MRRFGLVGHPVEHSWSKKIHEEYYRANGIDASYELVNMADIKDLRKVMERMDGVNVTIPYKKSVIPMLDCVSDEAREVGAVNTVVKRNGCLCGYNTDVAGFRKMAEGIEGKRALVLGDGGAAQAVKHVLSGLGCPFRCVTHGEMDDELVSVKDFDVVVNATPLGMFPDVGTCPPIDYETVRGGMIFLDLVYNPEVTEFMRRGMEHGATVTGGLVMLKEQAHEAIRLFLLTNEN